MWTNVLISVSPFFFLPLPFVNSSNNQICDFCVLANKQDEIESAMDEAANDSADLVGDTEEAGAEARGFVSEALQHQTNTRNSGKFREKCRNLEI